MPGEAMRSPPALPSCLYHNYCDRAVVDLVNNPILTLTHPVAIVAGEFFAVAGPGFRGKCFDAFKQSRHVRPRNPPAVRAPAGIQLFL